MPDSSPGHHCGVNEPFDQLGPSSTTCPCATCYDASVSRHQATNIRQPATASLLHSHWAPRLKTFHSPFRPYPLKGGPPDAAWPVSGSGKWGKSSRHLLTEAQQQHPVKQADAATLPPAQDASSWSKKEASYEASLLATMRSVAAGKGAKEIWMVAVNQAAAENHLPHFLMSLRQLQDPGRPGLTGNPCITDHLLAGWRRLALVEKAVRWGFNVLVTDVDVVWFRNPYTYLEDVPGADVVVLDECPADQQRQWYFFHMACMKRMDNILVRKGEKMAQLFEYANTRRHQTA
ncbi:hypothetical protein WJX73_002017 [Symbiochloris irregularis]|uniref:Nucleotide-diphospho-sugar transferase domain-containing protein n=1 Tax=Symbiochloris irregularis TaxID=706552 RepID=A0AAW1P2N3_9CHLO